MASTWQFLVGSAVKRIHRDIRNSLCERARMRTSTLPADSPNYEAKLYEHTQVDRSESRPGS